MIPDSTVVIHLVIYLNPNKYVFACLFRTQEYLLDFMALFHTNSIYALYFGEHIAKLLR